MIDCLRVSERGCAVGRVPFFVGKRKVPGWEYPKNAYGSENDKKRIKKGRNRLSNIIFVGF